MSAVRVGAAGLAAALALLAAACATSTPGGLAPPSTAAIPRASSQPAAGPTAIAQPCASFAASHALLQLTAARENSDGSLTVTGHRATMVCGGPDDFHYNFAAATVTGQVRPDAALQVLSPSLRPTAIAHSKFPAYLATDQNVRVFVVAGPLTAIAALTEQFHP